MNNVGEFLETIYDVIFKPKEAFQKFAQTPQILQACLVVFITTTLSLIAISAGSGGVSYRGGLIVLQLIGNFTTLFIMVAIWHLIAELRSGKVITKCCRFFLLSSIINHANLFNCKFFIC